MKKSVIVAAAGLSLLAAQGPTQASAQACKLIPIGSAEVVAVRDGRTLLLGDGRELRLAAIEPLDEGAALRALAQSRALRLEKLGAERDRYGRLVAFAFAGDAAQSLQERLLAQGAALVAARVGDKACASVLLAAEKQAREARRGLWADPNFAPLQADNLAGLGAKTGHFALVEGKVLSVNTSGSTIYLNFGYRWTRDFAVVIPRRSQGGFRAAGLELKTLEGRRVRVRGFIDRRRGPIVEADAPEQIEIIP